jgi:hypothetical protein
MATKSKTPIYYEPPKPSPLPEDYEEFMASLTEKEKMLFEIAKEKLGSSFFVQWTHLYKRWKASKK